MGIEQLKLKKLLKKQEQAFYFNVLKFRRFDNSKIQKLYTYFILTLVLDLKKLNLQKQL